MDTQLNSTYLRYLNQPQLKAVEHAPNAPLQILAGPGSGKTKVLTSRIAHLILQHAIPPSSICAVTFTNKAANEMRERLNKLIGKQKTDDLKLGTFHAICGLFLRRYAAQVGLANNFTICDADESKKIISNLLKPYKDDLLAKDLTLKEGTVLSRISSAKSKGLNAAAFLLEAQKTKQASKSSDFVVVANDIELIVAEIYQEYERTLRKSNSLDFDDLLVYGVKLFSQHRNAVQWCRHVLVDEFQDTNILQYELMRYLATSHNCVTVVGDPDQSIYGWRSAEIQNLSKMCKEFRGTEQIFLEENYRSAASILAGSLAIISQDKARIPKTLHTSHPKGTTPVLCSWPSEFAEAAFIAVEIKRLIANMGGMLIWSDFVILLRFNALSRVIESTLQKEGIPSRILGGHKFFERLEIKDLLAYLQVTDNPQFVPSFIRAIGAPSRGVGEKTLAELLARAQALGISPLEVIERIHDSKIPDIKPAVKRKVSSFVKTIRTLRKLSNEGASPADLIRRLFDLIDYEGHLRKTQPDWENRWENVQELINFASEVEVESSDIDPRAGVLCDDGREAQSANTPLRKFLQASMLSSEGDSQNNAEDNNKVTISTCHAAKGLEWPVVIIPAVEKGTFPFYRTDDIEEERRLLYVACTRAQSLLYLVHSSERKVAGETKTKELSEFMTAAIKDKPTTFTSKLPEFSPSDRAVIAQVLGRPEPETCQVVERVAAFNQTQRYHAVLSASKEKYSGPTQKFQTTSTFQSSVSCLTSIGRPLGQLPRQVTTPSAGLALLNPNTSARGGNAVLQPMNRHTASLSQITISTASQAEVFAGPSQMKRRLGMGRAAVGYPNKKFKPPS